MGFLFKALRLWGSAMGYRVQVVHKNSQRSAYKKLLS